MNLRNKLKNRLKKSGGFTLIEMLIVVAIIAILVAVSIPMVSSNLEDAKIATDKANERAAKAAAMITYMTGDVEIAANDVFYYNAETGKLGNKDEKPSNGYGQCKEHKKGYIKVTFTDANGTIELKWDGVNGSTNDVTPHEIDD